MEMSYSLFPFDGREPRHAILPLALLAVPVERMAWLYFFLNSTIALWWFLSICLYVLRQLSLLFAASENT